MCTNFIPTALDLLTQFGIERAPFDYKEEAYPGYDAPILVRIVRKTDEQGATREALPARFGLIPSGVPKEEIKSFVRDYRTENARAETAYKLRSFRSAWKNRQFCIIPVNSFYEPNWESGKCVRWRIWLPDTPNFAIAGLWEKWERGDESFYSFAMLTVNADIHPVMMHFHKHGQEKRMPVILHPDEIDAWLDATTDQAALMCRQYPANLMASEPAPRPSRPKKII